MRFSPAWSALGFALAAALPARGGDMVRVPGAAFTAGDRAPLPGAGGAEGRALWPEDIFKARARAGWKFEAERPAAAAPFEIDRTEVTNAAYGEFLAWMRRNGDHSRCHPGESAGKDHTPRYWKDFNPLLKDPGYARTAPFGPGTFRKPDAPVVGVDWYDAYAYAAWAGKRLPTDDEWELACGGPEGRRWPWGNDWRWGLANAGGEKKGRDISAKGFEKDGFIYPAPAGSFPEGASPYGCLDMAGNAAEWTSGGDARARPVRGGSSASYPSGTRCAARVLREPEFRSFDLGFRCAK